MESWPSWVTQLRIWTVLGRGGGQGHSPCSGGWPSGGKGCGRGRKRDYLLPSKHTVWGWGRHLSLWPPNCIKIQLDVEVLSRCSACAAPGVPRKVHEWQRAKWRGTDRWQLWPSPGRHPRAESSASTPEAPGELSRLAERCRIYTPCPKFVLHALCSVEGRMQLVVMGVSAPVPPSCGSHCLPGALQTDAVMPETSLLLGKPCLPPPVLWQGGPGGPTLLFLPTALCTQHRGDVHHSDHQCQPAR